MGPHSRLQAPSQVTSQSPPSQLTLQLEPGAHSTVPPSSRVISQVESPWHTMKQLSAQTREQSSSQLHDSVQADVESVPEVCVSSPSSTEPVGKKTLQAERPSHSVAAAVGSGMRIGRLWAVCRRKASVTTAGGGIGTSWLEWHVVGVPWERHVAGVPWERHVAGVSVGVTHRRRGVGVAHRRRWRGSDTSPACRGRGTSLACRGRGTPLACVRSQGIAFKGFF